MDRRGVFPVPPEVQREIEEKMYRVGCNLNKIITQIELDIIRAFPINKENRTYEQDRKNINRKDRGEGA